MQLKNRLMQLKNKLRREAQCLRTYFKNRKNYTECYKRKVSLFRALRWYGPWRASLCQGRNPIADRSPWIVFGAKEFLAQLLKPGCKVFEYGMGGSTLFFLDSGCHVISIEHNPEWGERLYTIIGNNARWKPIVIEPRTCANLNEAIKFKSEFPGYENSDFEEYIGSLSAQPDESLNIVMIDGRARSSALETATEKVAPSGVIVLDNAERDRYANTINRILAQGWHEKRLFGPGPYVRNEYWDTTFLFKPHGI